MDKTPFHEKLHIAWRVYFGITAVLQIYAIYTITYLHFALQGATSTSEASAMALGAGMATAASGLIIFLFGIINTVIAIYLYRNHMFNKIWQRVIVGIVIVSFTPLLFLIGSAVNYYVEQSNSIKQIESNSDSGKFIPLSQPKSQQ